MRFQFATRTLWPAAAVIAPAAQAFTVRRSRGMASSSTFMGSHLLVTTGAASKAAQQRSMHGTGSMTMLLDSLFGGGLQEQKIDYSTLDHPGPELAKFAEAGQVPENSEKEPHLKLAQFAGGCFWGVELKFQRVPGVVHTAVGYAQGKEGFPTYGEVCGGATGHTEALAVYYDPSACSYDQLLDAFFDFVDPTIVNGQGSDRGPQYRTGVYYHSKEQEEIARKRFAAEQQKYKKPLASELKPAMPFWPAEKYHQQYLEKGGRFGQAQDASKGANDTIRCYG